MAGNIVMTESGNIVRIKSADVLKGPMSGQAETQLEHSVGMQVGAGRIMVGRYVFTRSQARELAQTIMRAIDLEPITTAGRHVETSVPLAGEQLLPGAEMVGDGAMFVAVQAIAGPPRPRCDDSTVPAPPAKRVSQVGEVGVSHTPPDVGDQVSSVFVNCIDDRDQAMELQELIDRAVLRASFAAPAPPDDQERLSVVTATTVRELDGRPFQYPVSVASPPNPQPAVAVPAVGWDYSDVSGAISRLLQADSFVPFFLGCSNLDRTVFVRHREWFLGWMSDGKSVKVLESRGDLCVSTLAQDPNPFVAGDGRPLTDPEIARLTSSNFLWGYLGAPSSPSSPSPDIAEPATEPAADPADEPPAETWRDRAIRDPMFQLDRPGVIARPTGAHHRHHLVVVDVSEIQQLFLEALDTRRPKAVRTYLGKCPVRRVDHTNKVLPPGVHKNSATGESPSLRLVFRSELWYSTQINWDSRDFAPVSSYESRGLLAELTSQSFSPAWPRTAVKRSTADPQASRLGWPGSGQWAVT
jgi:hypothetical protein